MKFRLLIALVFSVSGVLAQTNTPLQRNLDTVGKLRIEKGKPVWMLTYFRQRYPTRIEIDSNGKTVEVPLPDPMLIAKLHIALSTDGRHWFPINHNKPVWDSFMRDPFVHRGPDGLWRIVATGGGKDIDHKKVGPGCFYVTSRDLVHWKVGPSLALMKDVRNDTGALARNIWAPEWFYNRKGGEYMLFWSSTFEDAGWKKSRLWYCTTRDWKTFTRAKVLFNPPYSVIDGTMLEHKGTFYLFHKEEEFGAQTGERRAIRVATSHHLKGPYQTVEGDMNGGQIAPVITEGPTVIKDPVRAGWLLLYDYPMADDFGASYSEDLIHWTVDKDVRFPPDARHGSVSQLTSDEAEALLKAYPNEK